MDKRKKFLIRFFGAMILLILIAELYFIHYLIIKKELGIDGGEAFSAAFTDMIKQPFRIFPIPSLGVTILVVVDIFLPMLIFLEYQNAKQKRHYDPNKVQGDSKWLEGQFLADYDMRFTEPFGVPGHDGKNNMILSKEMFMSLDNRGIADHNNHNSRNANVLAIGGSGAGKTFGLSGPNIMQANCSFVVTDPSGELFANYSQFLENQGYKVKCLNLDHMEKSNHYNPFRYIESDKDVEVLVTTLINNTTPPEKSAGDPFWEKSEVALLCALIAYLHHYSDIAPRPLGKSFSYVMGLLHLAAINEKDDTYENELDLLFKDVEKRDPQSFAVSQYRTFKLGAGKTLKSILLSVSVRLQAFALEAVMNLTDTDDIDLDRIGDEKTALFCIIPTGEKTFNFISAMMFSQLFQKLYSYCENYASYTQCIYDGDGELVCSFEAKSQEESDKVAKVKAEAYLKKAKDASVVYEEELNLYMVKAKDGSCLTYRSNEGDAQTALAKLRAGSIKQNSKRSLPIHTRFILDEFANTGRIPDFAEKVSTMRKYSISVTIILQSIQQLKNLYREEWETISGNCDNTLYLGGGADLTTTEWISKLIGKETRVVMSTSFKGYEANMSLNRTGVDLYSPSQLRTMPENECIVLQKSLDAYHGIKYNATMHKNWKYCDGKVVYLFDEKRYKFLKKMTEDAGEKGSEDAPLNMSEHGLPVSSKTKDKELAKAVEETKKIREVKNRQNVIRAKEAEVNMDADGKPKISEGEKIDAADIKDRTGVKTEEDIKETISSIIEDNEVLDFDECDYIAVHAGK